jgi:hypothetical protein
MKKGIEQLSTNARKALVEIVRYKIDHNGLSLPLQELQTRTGLCRTMAVAARIELIDAGLIKRAASKYLAIVGEQYQFPDWCKELIA